MIIEIKSKKHGVFEMQIDDNDYAIIRNYKLFLSKESKDTSNNLYYVVGYLKTDNSRKLQRIHRVLTNAVKGQIVDHIDHNPLNNMRSNLRLGDHALNMQNTRLRKGKTLPKGVSKTSDKTQYRARLYRNGKQMELGKFKTVEEAEKCYLNACKNT